MYRDFLTLPILKALRFIQAAQSLHILSRQAEIEDVKIFGDVIFIFGAGYRDVTRLNLPTEDNLRGRLGIFFREPLNRRVSENFLSVAATAERIPTFNDRAEFRDVSLKLRVLIENVILILHDGGNNRCGEANSVEGLRRVVIGNAD